MVAGEIELVLSERAFDGLICTYDTHLSAGVHKTGRVQLAAGYLEVAIQTTNRCSRASLAVKPSCLA